ncbi:MAG: phosphoribosylformylglycinamidine synthase subunit PurQ [Calditrichae bacterium]|nr:phosphoribosylformylglycinamidine synthase subunit PurQ [Calditrichia bacterium]NIW78218.1 phosphoribosylformylglycinamidine synthase subunit PurQ [Calditrichia bacterium]
MKSAVIVFPGSNCDHDMKHALDLMGHQVDFIWHKNAELSAYDLVVLPGGFSYGDYLRAGAIAGFSPIMSAVTEFAKQGKLVLGICNGFQVLAEIGLLPGALLRNQNLRFICRYIYLRTENSHTRFTNAIVPQKPLRIPIAHGEGRFYIDEDGLKALQDNQQIIFRYVNAENHLRADVNPNGSIDSIAGVINKEGNVLGMMPHPERAVETLLGSNDGRYIFQSLAN